MSIFKGSGVAIVTPFTEDGSVNYDDLGKLLEFQIENGTDAIIICGTTGEASTLSDEEQAECVRFTVKKVNKRIPVLAGAGSNDTKHGCELSKACVKAGADAILSVTPYYNKTSQAGLIKHYEMIAAAIDVPLIPYSVAGRTGMNIEPSTVYELSKIPNVVGIKEASGNLSQVAQIAALCGPDFDIWSGNDDQILPVMSLGGKGVISVAANIMPKQMHELATSFLSGDVKRATALQLEYLAVMNALFYEVNPIPVKAALELMGLSKAFYRAPLCEIGSGNLQKLKAEMEKAGLI